MYHIVYLTTNLVNQKIYVGVHSTYNLDDGYIGSGLTIKYAIRKYSKVKFSRQILYYCLTRTDALEKESQIVDKYFISRKDTYNSCIGGYGGSLDYINNLSDEEKLLRNKNISIKKLGKTVKNGGRKSSVYDKELKIKIAKLRNEIYGNPSHSEEARLKISKFFKNKTYEEIHGKEKATQLREAKRIQLSSEEYREKRMKNRAATISNYTEEQKFEQNAKISKALKGKPKSEAHKQKLKEAALKRFKK